MKPRFFKVERRHHAYLTFITESYEGLCTVSTVDNARGIIRILPADGQEQDLDGLVHALQDEIGMEEIIEDESTEKLFDCDLPPRLA